MSFRDLAQALTSKGIVSLRYEIGFVRHQIIKQMTDSIDIYTETILMPLMP